MINTFTSFQLITRDMERSIDRIEAQPMVSRETKYYLENIGKVETIEEFVNDERLFRYAMKAHGLEDMAYAKAFMVKALEEGVTDKDSFANKLSDRRYRDFVETFNFASRGESTTTYNPAQKGTIDKYMLAAAANGIDTSNQQFLEGVNYYLEKIPQVKTIDDLLADDQLLTVAMIAHGFEGTFDKQLIREMLEGGIDDPDSMANQHSDDRYAKFVATFNFARYGEDTTTINITQSPTVDRYLRQTLEEDAGRQNEGVRMALYFQRKAESLTNFYEVLADPALSQVVRTALGFPAALAQSDIDKQVELFKSRLDIKDFKDPEKLDDFLKRFTSLWEIDNPSSSQRSSIAALFTQPAEYGISTDVLLTIAQMKR